MPALTPLEQLNPARFETPAILKKLARPSSGYAMTEDQLEQEALGWLAEAGYATLFGPDIASDGDQAYPRGPELALC